MIPNLNHHAFQNFPAAPSWAVFWRDFDNENDADAFSGTALNSGTLAVTTDRKHGWFRFSGAATTDNSGYQYQADMETISLNLGKKVLAMFRCMLSETTSTNGAAQSEVYCGLAITDITLLDGTGTLAGGLTHTDSIGIYKPDGEATCYGVIVRDSVRVGTVGPFPTSFVDDVAMEFAIEVVMDSVTAGKGIVTFYQNGAVVGQLESTTLPYDSEEILTPSFAYNTGDNTGTKFCDLDYVGVAQER